MKKVLIVDDEKDICDFFDYIAKELGFDTVIAYDGEDALDLLKNDSNITHIISDIRMPKMNGIDFYNEVLKLHQKLEKFIFISGNDEYKQNIKQTNAVFLKKPISYEEIESALI